MTGSAGRARYAAPRVVVLAASLSAGGCGFDAPEPFVTDRGAYSEFVDYREVTAELDGLAAAQTELYLAISAEDIGTGALEALLSRARGRGIPVRAWLLLSDEEGYWPGEDNLEAFEDLVDAFWTWNSRADLGVQWIVVDMEPPLEISNELAAAVESGRLDQAIPLLLANRDAVEHEASRQAWAAAVDRWHERGIQVGVVALPYLLDDYGDDDLEIADMFESPIDGIAWDEVGFLVYQNLFLDADGAPLGPALVHSYALTAKARFGDRASIALGTIGSVGKNTMTVGYDEPVALGADIAAARAAGVEKLHLFGLDGMLERGGTAKWLDDLHPSPRAPEPSEAVEESRDLVEVLDRL